MSGLDKLRWARPPPGAVSARAITGLLGAGLLGAAVVAGARNVLRANPKRNGAVVRLLCAAVATTGPLLISQIGIGSASAAGCPDVQVVFARGIGEPPGVGPTGEAFINSLRPRVGGRSLDVYAVNYPASDDWPTGVNGIKDAGAHVVRRQRTVQGPRSCSAVIPKERP